VERGKEVGEKREGENKKKPCLIETDFKGTFLIEQYVHVFI
jgi:hypothetical protein